jgi:hypothetical protein
VTDLSKGVSSMERNLEKSEWSSMMQRKQSILIFPKRTKTSSLTQLPFKYVNISTRVNLIKLFKKNHNSLMEEKIGHYL